MNCIFCNNIIPESRKSFNHKNPKYCSVECIKRAYYLRKNPDKKSYINHNPKFWETKTGIGFKWEVWASNFLNATHNKFKKGADLNYNGKLIDVKVSKGYNLKNSTQWVFNRNKIKPIDFFFCIALKNDKVYKLFFIPNNNFPKCGATIGDNSKYDKFQIHL